MKLITSRYPHNPYASFLDVIFCLCVFLFTILSIMFVANKSNNISNEKYNKNENLEKASESHNQVVSARFRGRGGQPILPVTILFNEEGLNFKIGSYKYSWFEFRCLVSNFDRKEAHGNPAFLFNMTYSLSYLNVPTDTVYQYMKDTFSMNDIEQYKEKYGRDYLIYLYKKKYSKFESICRQFKKEYTTIHLGNWDLEEIQEKQYTSYSERRDLGFPYLWFSVENETKKIKIGPLNNQLKISAEQFVDLIGSVKGGDGFYIEYRSVHTNTYDQNLEVPNWVRDDVLEPLGFYAIVAN